MAEILMSIMLASVLIVSVLVVLTQLLAGAQKSSDLASGAVVAERLLNDIVNQPTLAAGGPVQGMLRSGPAGEAATEFHYSTDIQSVDSSNPVGLSYLVTVDVWWTVDSPTQQKAGVGKLSTRLSRIVYRSEATPQP
jgi:hypothetical protein